MNKAKQSPPIPPDATAYLMQAAEEIACIQEFKPQSQEEMGQWLQANITLVATRAQELQQELLNKLFADNKVEPLKKVLATRVWSALRRKEITSQEQQAYNEIFKPEIPRLDY